MTTAGHARLAARVAGWQSALLGTGLLTGRPVGTVAGLAAAGLVAATATRFSGRWSDQWLTSYARYRRRAAPARTGRALDAIVPGLDIRVHADRAGNRVGLLADGGAWTAILRLDPLPDQDLAPRLDDLLSILRSTVHSGAVRVAAVQLVVWTVPAAGRALRAYWVAVRFEPPLDPVAVAARGGGEPGALRCAAIAALRVAASLRQRGFPSRVLDGTELPTELAVSLGEPATGPAAVRETWWSWSVGALHHACYRPRRGSRGGRAERLVRPAAPPALSSCASVRFARETPEGEETLRVAVPAPAGARAASRRVRADLGHQVVPLHGEHLAAVGATLPLGRARR